MAKGDPDPQRIARAEAPRIVGRGGPDGRDRITVINGPKDGWRDVYHYLLTWSWLRFIGLTAAIYLAVNLLFALAYWADVSAVTGGRPGSFMDAFNFSVETLGTIGYGAMSPHDLYTNLLVLVEAFTSIFLTAVLTGLIFARVSRPTARVLFSNVALVTTFDGARVLMFRAANQRPNQMLEAEVTLNLTRRLVTQEGVAIRRFEELPTKRPRSPLFALSWTVIHVIDEASPLHEADIDALRKTSAEIIITLSGVDEVTSQRVHSRHSYVVDELRWDQHFVDVVFPRDDDSGQWVIDYGKFHDIKPTPTAPA